MAARWPDGHSFQAPATPYYCSVDAFAHSLGKYADYTADDGSKLKVELKSLSTLPTILHPFTNHDSELADVGPNS